MKIEICDFIFFMSIALFLVMLTTKAYKKSYSTAIVVTILPLIIWANNEHIKYLSNVLNIAVATFLLIRAIINNKNDKLIKRSRDE